jgi:hypothetical protein
VGGFEAVRWAGAGAVQEPVGGVGEGAGVAEAIHNLNAGDQRLATLGKPQRTSSSRVRRIV